MKSVMRAALILTSILFSATAAYPCSCGEIKPRKSFKEADVVFVGQVVEVFLSRVANYPTAIKYKVEKQWKGKKKSEILIFSDGDSPGMCGDINLSIGREHLIYAYKEKEGLVIGIDCGPNREIEDAEGIIKKLNNPFYRFFARLSPF